MAKVVDLREVTVISTVLYIYVISCTLLFCFFNPPNWVMALSISAVASTLLYFSRPIIVLADKIERY